MGFVSNKNSRTSAYTDLKDNNPLCESYASAMNTMGHNVILDAAGHKGVLTGGSTDMGELIPLPGPRRYDTNLHALYRKCHI